MSGSAPAYSDESGDGPDAAALADEARRSPGVVDLTGGPFDGVATYLPGARVPGIRILADVIEVHVVVSMSARSLPAVGDDLRARLVPLGHGRRIDVFIDDVVLDELTP